MLFVAGGAAAIALSGMGCSEQTGDASDPYAANPNLPPPPSGPEPANAIPVRCPW
jgi:hypothetical protein